MNIDPLVTMKNAILVGIQLPSLSPFELKGSLDELHRLVTTLGYEVVGRLTQKRESERAATLLGEGKLRELAKWTGGTGKVTGFVEHKKSKAAMKWELESQKQGQTENEHQDDSEAPQEDDLSDSELDSEAEVPETEIKAAQIVIVDCDLTPSQLRNLESATGVKVLDRTGIIIEIFSRHAKTKAAQAQVEIARLTYMAPRLRETSGGGDRQGGGIGAKGSGETSLELDKRKIRDRIKELKEELKDIGKEQDQRRSRRGQELCVALVGYTNAGKSSLMRAMTGSQVFVADKLFATLDTTVRPIYPETRPKILLSDTVGFIKKLPHDLIASFKSTLDEALNASLLLFVVDASDPSFRSQLKVTTEVLAEVGADTTPKLLILNKEDRLSAEEKAQLKIEFPEALLFSTRSPEQVKQLRERLVSFFEKDMIEEELLIPYSTQGVIGEIRSSMKVVSEAFNEVGCTLRVRTNPELMAKIKKKLGK